MSNGAIRIPYDRMEDFLREVFSKLGVPNPDASICASHIVEADRRGISSHGVNRMKPFYYERLRKGLQKPVTRMEVVRETPTTAVVDGNFGMGHVIGKRSMEIAIDKAHEYGMGMVAVRNSTHYGFAGYYTKMAAESEMIGICGTNARPSVSPTFGTEGMMGTNPLSYSFPTDEEFPFVLDCATPITQRGRIEYYAREGKEVPPGWVIGSDGEYRTDTEGILRALERGEAAFLPLGGRGEESGGHKGYGYCAVVEVLSSALQAGPFLKSITGVNVGHFFMAVDISSFRDPEEFKKDAGEIMRRLRGSRKEPGRERIYTAGEKEFIHYNETKEKGLLLNGSIARDMADMREDLGIEGFDTDFV